MNNADHDVFVHLLIDNGMLHGLSTCYSEVDSQSRPSWLAPIYADHALAVSPFLVDVEAAYEAGDIDRVMGFLNARRPGLHVSIIETGLDLEQIARPPTVPENPNPVLAGEATDRPLPHYEPFVVQHELEVGVALRHPLDLFVGPQPATHSTRSPCAA